MRYIVVICLFFFFFSSRRRHTRCSRDWSSDVCSSDLVQYRHSQLFRLVIFRPRICSHHHIIGLIAHRPAQFSAVLLYHRSRFLPRSIRQRSSKDKRLPCQLIALDLALFCRGVHSRLRQFLDQLPVRRLREKLRDARRHLRTHFRYLFEFLLFCRRQLLQRGKLFRQQLPCSLAHKLNPQRIIQPRQRILLARCNLLQQILRGLFRHVLQCRHLLLFQRVQTRNILQQPLVHELVHNLLPQPVNVHGVPPRVMQNRFFPLRRARRIHTAVRHFPFHVMNGAPAFRAILRHMERLPVFPRLHHLQHVRNHFAGPLDQHRVANLHAQPLDFIHVVERRTADSDASHLHRLQDCHRRQRPRAPYVDENIFHHGRFPTRRILERNRPPRRLRRVTQFILYGRGIHLYHHAVDLVRQFLALVVPVLAIRNHFLNPVAQLPII